MVQIDATAIPDVKLVTPKRFGDHRGFFSETYRADWDLLPEGVVFTQDNHAFSATPNTIRGLHFQYGPSTQAKLLRCVVGAILDVAVDIRKGSPTYGQWVAEELSAENGRQLLVPHGFAHAYQTLTPDAHVMYKVDQVYDPQREGAVLWSDPAIGVEWAKIDAPPQLSNKDEVAPNLQSLDTPFVYDEQAPFHCQCLDRSTISS
ncbi:dTDP-4-dehydrorhamnose 3,5-epimerase [Parvularcula sp. LCG005]|uniref:dTDP-4-dehydrorhamnose 3,5-epimerase n=1 Tax=Parvularcula sp. LCG005 TaxID=3078805 RepID=UPI0029421C6D|nr:dTDP-4-dehydrorhamnose 3,5-epimerase [Parvularcula sp. LCG005]WOI53268.1 dTDP-4-dehydrorhamnose 3,5-epimerase [Parvularcula sp. LCG005]